MVTEKAVSPVPQRDVRCRTADRIIAAIETEAEAWTMPWYDHVAGSP